MKQKSKKIIIVVGLIILTLLVASCVTVFLMRDKSKLWCSYTFGSYEPIKYCDLGQTNCVEPNDDFLCVGGIFDLMDIRGTELVKSMEAYKKAYPIYLPGEGKRFKTDEESRNYMDKKAFHTNI